MQQRNLPPGKDQHSGWWRTDLMLLGLFNKISLKYIPQNKRREMSAMIWHAASRFDGFRDCVLITLDPSDIYNQTGRGCPGFTGLTALNSDCQSSQ